MKKKHLLPLLLVCGVLCLSSCSLFNDDDIAVTNTYNPSTPEETIPEDAVIAQGVVGKELSSVKNALAFKKIYYGNSENKIVNSYKENEFNINDRQDYPASEDANNYDLYVPNNANKNDKHVVILFIHGGAWVSGFKSDVNPYVYEFANKGYITATIKYTLLSEKMNNRALSIYRDLDEIDACIKSIKLALGDIGFDTSKTNLVIGGASSGAHLAMLYAYSRSSTSALPIRFIVDAVGPVDIKPDSWKAFVNPTDTVLTNGITPDQIEYQESQGNIGRLRIASSGSEVNYWNDYQTMRIANGMCGLPHTTEEVEATTDSNKENITNPSAASNDMLKADGGEDQLSVTYWIGKSTSELKVICAYAGQDSVVGIGQYAKLKNALDSKGYASEFYYFKNSNHTDITEKADATAYNDFINAIDGACSPLHSTIS